MTIIGAAQQLKEKEKLSPAWCLDTLLSEADYYRAMKNPEHFEIGDSLGRLIELIANALNISLDGSPITEAPYETREAMREWFWDTFAGTAVSQEENQ